MRERAINRQSARELDRRAIEEFGIPGIVLMENAGRGVADKLCDLGISGPVVICCGPGNNGGDGIVIARHLDLRGYEVQVLTWNCASPKPAGGQWPPGDAARNLAILEATKIPLIHNPSLEQLQQHCQRAHWIIDALLGTGARGEPRPPLDAVIETVNRSGKPIMAVDVPSGLDCDTGIPAKHTIRASHTCTFVAPKPGFFTPGAAACTGKVHLSDIGAPRVLVEQLLQPRA